MRYGFSWDMVPLPTSGIPLWRIIIGGFLVGFGVKLGNGCTSGHGICGLARLSLRSLVATSCFMLAGMVTTFAFSWM